ncbi:helix-turn-helix transcriptional regulator [Mycobacterium yunnanensis]|uniref:Helix-turn-helix transcriptional regulator n=1 Tax=Mycobacterium yunnanensis TaxID=368477 RepID=A0A9X2Z1M6_9MYCO|nr:helix-turn-helix transcriptional regulator [Mycobacterium yunnanensis]MCV7421275.1 helix-turn-helix transcriptional regulator [Mycobacterium yunnanensis]
MAPSGCLRVQEVHSDESAEITSYLNRVYRTEVDVRPLTRQPGRRLRVDHRRVSSSTFALESVRHDGDVEVRAEAAMGSVVVLWPVEGRAESQVGGRAGRAAAGELIIGSSAAEPVRIRTSDATLQTVVLDRRLLVEAAGDVGHVRPADVSFTGAEPVSASAGRALTAARRYVDDFVLSGDGPATPLVLAAAGRLLAATALAAFPNTVVTSDRDHLRDRRDVSDQPALLRRAMAFIEEHAAHDVGIGDVASAVYVTPRALQYMFRRHLDSTPMAYLRRVRLEHVHRELVDGDRSTITVTAAAARWGFAHTGRFAVLYRETYGQSPHVTLRS